MTQIETSLRNTKQSARRLRFEQTAALSATDVQTAVQQAQAAAGAGTSAPALTPTAVNAAMSPYVVTATDSLIEVDTTAGPVTISLPTASTRNSIGLFIKDIAGNAAVNNISVTSAEGIDGLTSYPIASAYGSGFFQPKTGGYVVL